MTTGMHAPATADDEDDSSGFSWVNAVQRAMWPAPTALPGYTIATTARSAREISGDLSDVAVDHERGYATITVGDVMGKGIASGVLAANLLGGLEVFRHEPPGEAVDAAETATRRHFERASAFATLFHARLRCRDGRIEFVDAGHGLTAHAHTSGTAERIPSADFPIGLQPAGMPRLPRILHLAPGELLLIVSDGLFELPGATMQTLTQLATNLRTAPDLQHVLSDFLEAAGSNLDDDTTLTAIRRDL
ncbi:MAG: PP2C family protein-serine/threonine phosphatase [Curtobacterium sp.]